MASQLEISNGHAARMRFSRFKQQMEGTTSTPRASKPKKHSKSQLDKTNPKADLVKTPISPPPAPVKQETPYDPQQSPYIKTDPDPYLQKIPTLENISPVQTPMEAPPMYHPPYPAQYPPQHRLPQVQHFPFTPYHYPRYHPQMTVAPADLAMHAPVSSFASQTPVGFDIPSTGHPVWAPVKREPETVGSEDLVKIEGLEY